MTLFLRQPIKHSWLTPQGQRLCEPYQNPDAGRHAPGVSYAPSI